MKSGAFLCRTSKIPLSGLGLELQKKPERNGNLINFVRGFSFNNFGFGCRQRVKSVPALFFCAIRQKYPIRVLSTLGLQGHTSKIPLCRNMKNGPFYGLFLSGTIITTQSGLSFKFRHFFGLCRRLASFFLFRVLFFLSTRRPRAGRFIRRIPGRRFLFRPV